ASASPGGARPDRRDGLLVEGGDARPAGALELRQRRAVAAQIGCARQNGDRSRDVERDRCAAVVTRREKVPHAGGGLQPCAARFQLALNRLTMEEGSTQTRGFDNASTRTIRIASWWSFAQGIQTLPGRRRGLARGRHADRKPGVCGGRNAAKLQPAEAEKRLPGAK